MLLTLRICAWLLALGLALPPSRGTSASTPIVATWKVGTAKVVITPASPFWLSGYASRKKPSQGKLQDLYLKALAIQDPAGNKAVLVTSDLLGFPGALADNIAENLRKRDRLKREQVLLTSSHTHTGPALQESLQIMYDLSAEDEEAVADYSNELQRKAVVAAEFALRHLVPARLSFHLGKANFAVNRRMFTPEGVKIGVNPEGPVDHSVPVLKAESLDGQLLAVVMAYACHNTTLTGEHYQFSGDYAGFAQAELESRYPTATALFVMGCGADANPNPRGTVELAKEHGQALAEAVSSALGSQQKEISGGLRLQFSRVKLPLSDPPSRAELEQRLNDPSVFRQRHARLMLQSLNQKGKLPRSYSAPLQVWQLGRSLTLVAFSGETVVDYGLQLKREFGEETLWPIAYANDFFAYVPTSQILKEGGYEAVDSGIYFGMPAPFAPQVEQTLLDKARGMIRSIRQAR
ncbi:MAG: neutral/alkaline non-lysosomal ceramidase N-terminal domain-containing protein [Acidobacteriota bacterium]